MLILQFMGCWSFGVNWPLKFFGSCTITKIGDVAHDPPETNVIPRFLVEKGKSEHHRHCL